MRLQEPTRSATTALAKLPAATSSWVNSRAVDRQQQLARSPPPLSPFPSQQANGIVFLNSWPYGGRTRSVTCSGRQAGRFQPQVWFPALFLGSYQCNGIVLRYRPLSPFLTIIHFKYEDFCRISPPFVGCFFLCLRSVDLISSCSSNNVDATF